MPFAMSSTNSGKGGERTEPRVLQIQFQDVKGNGVEQFKSPQRVASKTDVRHESPVDSPLLDRMGGGVQRGWRKDPLDRIGTPFKSALSFHADGIFALIYRKSIAQIMR
jgi:hypothetical protein